MRENGPTYVGFQTYVVCKFVFSSGTVVLTAELFNSALETIFHGLDEATKPRVRNCLDIAAGAVLLASLTAALIGAMVFLHRLAALLGPSPG